MPSSRLHCYTFTVSKTIIMKHIFIILAALPVLVFGQKKQGEVFYKEISRFEIEEQYKKYMPKDMPDSVVNETVLIFNENQSLYKNYENLDDESEPSKYEEMMSYWMGADNQTYRNLSEDKMIEKKDFQGKTFKIVDKIKDTIKWKIMPSTDEILGHSTMLATSTTDSTEVKVWFTTEAPVPFGPMTMGGLPGLILKMEFKTDKFGMKVIADKFVDRTIKEKEFKLPKGGQEVNRKEYDAIMKAKMEEMRKMRANGGQGRGH